MTSDEHLDWLEENIQWFSDLSKDHLDLNVPNCPGWTVETVLTHLAFGLGLAYPYALRAGPSDPPGRAFADVPWPKKMPSGAAALHAFSFEMTRCLSTFRSTNPTLTCSTYAGPGTAAFWFRRAAVETTLHRLDVAQALDRIQLDLPEDRARDAIAETLEFTLPLAAEMTSNHPATMRVCYREGTDHHTIGTGDIRATLTGDSGSLLGALWGRGSSNIDISGDVEVANKWLGLIETAFAEK